MGFVGGRVGRGGGMGGRVGYELEGEVEDVGVVVGGE